MQNSSYLTNIRFLRTLGFLTAAFLIVCVDAEASSNACKKIYDHTIKYIADGNWCLSKAGLSHISKTCDDLELPQNEKKLIQKNLKKTTAECDALDVQNTLNQQNTQTTLKKNKLFCGAPYSDDGTSTNACLAMAAAIGVKSVKVIPFKNKSLPTKLESGEINVAINHGRSAQKPTYVHVSHYGFVSFHVQPEPFSQIAKLAFESLDERTPKSRLRELNKLGMQLGLDEDWQVNVIDSYGTIDNLRGDKSYLKQKDLN